MSQFEERLRKRPIAPSGTFIAITVQERDALAAIVEVMRAIDNQEPGLMTDRVNALVEIGRKALDLLDGEM